MQDRGTDEFGYLPNPSMRTTLAGLTPAAGWFACYRFEPSKDDWYFFAVPQFMTVRREDLSDGSTHYCTFGVHEFLGRLQRMDWGSQFRGYAHESEFIVAGHDLSDAAKGRMEYGEPHMCGDPSRVYEDGRLVEQY